MSEEMKFKKYDFSGNVIEEVACDLSPLEGKLHHQVIANYVCTYQANQRQGSACTRLRSEVNHSNRKSSRQKGMGKARHRSLGAPQFKGGAVVFGPRPRSFSMKVNRKEKRAVLRYLLLDRARTERISLLALSPVKISKTKQFVQFLRLLKLQKRRVLLLSDSHEREGIAHSSLLSLQKGVSNLPEISFKRVDCANGYDILHSHHCLFTDQAWNQLTQKVAWRGK